GLDREYGLRPWTPEPRVPGPNESRAGEEIWTKLPANVGKELVTDLAAQEGRVARVKGERAAGVCAGSKCVAQASAETNTIADTGVTTELDAFANAVLSARRDGAGFGACATRGIAKCVVRIGARPRAERAQNAGYSDDG